MSTQVSKFDNNNNCHTLHKVQLKIKLWNLNVLTYDDSKWCVQHCRNQTGKF